MIPVFWIEKGPDAGNDYFSDFKDGILLDLNLPRRFT
jgi:hypothetical protein